MHRPSSACEHDKFALAASFDSASLVPWAIATAGNVKNSHRTEQRYREPICLEGTMNSSVGRTGLVASGPSQSVKSNDTAFFRADTLTIAVWETSIIFRTERGLSQRWIVRPG